MIANYDKLVKHAKRHTKNTELAYDVVQELMLYFHRKPKNHIKKSEPYIKRLLRFTNYNYYNKWLKRWDKSMDSQQNSEGEEYNLHEYLSSDFDLYETVEKKMLLEKLVDEYHNICYPMQREALDYFIEHGDDNNPEKNIATSRLSREQGLERIRVFTKTGTYKKVKKTKYEPSTRLHDQKP